MKYNNALMINLPINPNIARGKNPNNIDIQRICYELEQPYLGLQNKTIQKDNSKIHHLIYRKK